MYDVQRRGQPLDDDDARSAIRRGLQARRNPNHHAESTGSSERGAPTPSDSPHTSLPPGPPSDSASKSNESGKSSKGSGKSTVPPPTSVEATAPPTSAAEQKVERAAHSMAEPGVRPPMGQPPTWAELDAQFYAERAALAQGMPQSTVGAPSSSVGQSTVPPPSWMELAYRRFYAERAAQSTAGPGVRPPMGKPPTMTELEAHHLMICAERHSAS